MTQRDGLIILRPSAEGRMLRLLLPGFFLLVVLIAAVVLSKLGLCCLVLCMLAALVLRYVLSGRHEIRFEPEQAVE